MCTYTHYLCIAPIYTHCVCLCIGTHLHIHSVHKHIDVHTMHIYMHTDVHTLYTPCTQHAHTMHTHAHACTHRCTHMYIVHTMQIGITVHCTQMYANLLWRERGSNPRRADYDSTVLPTELSRQRIVQSKHIVSLYLRMRKSQTCTKILMHNDIYIWSLWYVCLFVHCIHCTKWVQCTNKMCTICI